MCVIGVDCATQPKSVGLALCILGAERARIEEVADAGDQRHLGTDDGQSDVARLCKLCEPGEVVDADVDILHPGLGRGAGVARRDVNHVDAATFRRRPGERMFPTARSHHEYAHVACPQ